MAKITLPPISNFGQAAIGTVNANFDAIEAAFENTLSRNGLPPNQMTADLDLNGNDLLNAGIINADQLLINGADVSLARWYVGTGVPSPSLGVDGDLFLRTDTGQVYGPKDSGSWGLPQTNLTGPQGPQGAVGPRGLQGIQGVQGVQGIEGPQGPAGAQGIQGNSFTPDAIGLTTDRATYDGQVAGFSFLDSELGILYFKLSATSGDWSNGTAFTTGPQGPLGPQGIQGIQGEQGIQGVEGPEGPPGEGLPVGGTAGQILSKIDATDFNTEWIDLPVADPSSYVLLSDYAVLDGVTNDRAALAAADDAALLAGKALLVDGPCLVGSAITIDSHVAFLPPGMLIPDSTVVITIGDRISAGPHQIIDRTEGGTVNFAKGAGTVWAEWWGARANPSGRTDNEVPIQWAIDACGSIVGDGGAFGPAPNGDGNGGRVRFASSQVYLMSGRIHLRQRTILAGNAGGFSPTLKANVATWGADVEMVLSQNSTFSQFWCRIENMALDASGIASIARVVYAPAWQESSGLRDVLVQNFHQKGLEVDNFYGGSVGFTLKQVQFFPDATPGSACKAILVDCPFTQARAKVILDDVSFAGITTLAPPGINLTGIDVTGRVDVINNGVHLEGYDQGWIMRGASSLFGVISCGGNPSVEDVIQLDDDFVGQIDCLVTKGGATRLLRSFRTSPTTLYLQEPFNRRVVYPGANVVSFAAGRVTGGTGTPSLASGYGVATVNKDSTGLYTLTFNTSVFSPGAGGDYRARIAVQSTTVRNWYTNAATSTGIQIAFKDPATNALADVGDFDFEIVGRPGY